jgi:hypothetical protein
MDSHKGYHYIPSALPLDLAGHGEGLPFFLSPLEGTETKDAELT